MIGAMMFLKGCGKNRVYGMLKNSIRPIHGTAQQTSLPWHEIIDGDLEV